MDLKVASTLLEAGLGPQNYNVAPRKLVLEIIQEARSMNGGLVGFSMLSFSLKHRICVNKQLGPGMMEPDLDDSAKASIILSLSGKPGFSEDIIRSFDAPKALKTYRIERDPSISANCNALLSMILDERDYPSKSTTIEKVVSFICDSWIDTDGSIKDKWVSHSHRKYFALAVRIIQRLIRCRVYKESITFLSRNVDGTRFGRASVQIRNS